MYKLYHNNRCSKSRDCLKLLEDRKVNFEKIEYLKIQINKKSMKELVFGLKDSLELLIRTSESDFKENKFIDFDNKEKVVDFLLKFPKCIQRPIFFDGKKYHICRPPEKVLDYI